MNQETKNIIDNPLIWPLLSIINASPEALKIHYIFADLEQKGLLDELDSDANKALFKRNFLIMNGLYQLQALLLPEQWLQVHAMDIRLMEHTPDDVNLIFEADVALRSYYLDWSHFETSADSIDRLFASFWRRYDKHIGQSQSMLDKTLALQIFELENNATDHDIRRQWRKLALQWHPDREEGNAQEFNKICQAWKTLRR